MRAPFGIARALVVSLAIVCVAPALVAEAQGASQQAAPAPAQEQPGQVNLNTATEAELVRLPGVGPARARAIIARRTRRPFRRVSEVMRIRGIGRRTFRRLRPMLTLSGPTTLR